MSDSCQHCGRVLDPGEPAILSDHQARVLCRPCSEPIRRIILRHEFVHYGITSDDAERMRAELSLTFGRSPNRLEVIHALCDDATVNDESRRASLYLSLAVEYHFAGRDPTPIKRVAAEIRLRSFQNSHVKIMGSNDACPECRKLHGLVMTREQALAEIPVPCPRCEKTRGEEILEPGGYVSLPFGWCRCIYVATRPPG